MAGVGPLSRAARLSQRRFLRRHAPRTADMLFLSWLMIVILVRFTVNCLLAARLLGRGPAGVGQAVTELTMLHFLVIAFLLPLLSSLLSLGTAGLDRKRLTLTGISLGSLTLVELAGLATHPLTWVALLFSLPAAIAVASLPAPGLGIVAMVALITVSLAALFAAHALGNLLSTSRTAHRISGAFRLGSTAALLGVLFSNADFQWTSGVVKILLFQHPTLLVDDAGRGLLGFFRPWCPSVWIYHGWIVPCALLMAASLGLYVLSLRGTYNTADDAGSPRRRTLNERAGGKDTASVVYRHELQYFVRSLGGVSALCAGIGAGIWLLAAREPSLNIALLGGVIALAAGFTYSSNTFGHDGHALRRYALLCPDWSMVFAAKNRAWLTVMGSIVLFLAAADAVRVSLSSALSLLPGASLVLALSVLWGNVSSVLLPARMGSGQAHAFVNQAAPFAFFFLPLAIHSNVAPFGSAGFVITVCICLGAAVALYLFLLRRISRTFDADVERVLARFQAEG